MAELKANTASWLDYLGFRNKKLKDEGKLDRIKATNDDVVAGSTEDKVVYAKYDNAADTVTLSDTEETGYTKVDLDDGLSFEEMKALGIEKKDIDVIAGQGWKLAGENGVETGAEADIIEDDEIEKMEAAVKKYAAAKMFTDEEAWEAYYEAKKGFGRVDLDREIENGKKTDEDIKTEAKKSQTISAATILGLFGITDKNNPIAVNLGKYISDNNLVLSNDDDLERVIKYVRKNASGSTRSQFFQENILMFRAPIATKYEGDMGLESLKAWAPAAKGYKEVEKEGEGKEAGLEGTEEVGSGGAEEAAPVAEPSVDEGAVVATYTLEEVKAAADSNTTIISLLEMLQNSGATESVKNDFGALTVDTDSNGKADAALAQLIVGHEDQEITLLTRKTILSIETEEYQKNLDALKVKLGVSVPTPPAEEPAEEALVVSPPETVPGDAASTESALGELKSKASTTRFNDETQILNITKELLPKTPGVSDEVKADFAALELPEFSALSKSDKNVVGSAVLSAVLAIGTDEYDLRITFARGVCFYYNEKYDAAITEFEKTDNEIKGRNFWIACCYLKQGEDAKALEYFKKENEQYPSDATNSLIQQLEGKLAAPAPEAAAGKKQHVANVELEESRVKYNVDAAPETITGPNEVVIRKVSAKNDRMIVKVRDKLGVLVSGKKATEIYVETEDSKVFAKYRRENDAESGAGFELVGYFGADAFENAKVSQETRDAYALLVKIRDDSTFDAEVYNADVYDEERTAPEKAETPAPVPETAARLTAEQMKEDPELDYETNQPTIDALKPGINYLNPDTNRKFYKVGNDVYYSTELNSSDNTWGRIGGSNELYKFEDGKFVKKPVVEEKPAPVAATEEKSAALAPSADGLIHLHAASINEIRNELVDLGMHYQDHTFIITTSEWAGESKEDLKAYSDYAKANPKLKVYWWKLTTTKLKPSEEDRKILNEQIGAILPDAGYPYIEESNNNQVRMIHIENGRAYPYQSDKLNDAKRLAYEGRFAEAADVLDAISADDRTSATRLNVQVLKKIINGNEAALKSENFSQAAVYYDQALELIAIYNLSWFNSSKIQARLDAVNRMLASVPAPEAKPEAASEKTLARLTPAADGLIHLHENKQAAWDYLCDLHQNKNENVVIIFTAKDCGICQDAIRAKKYENFANAHPGVKVLWYNAKSYKDTDKFDALIAQEYGVKGWPSIMAVENGKVVKKELLEGELYSDQSEERSFASDQIKNPENGQLDQALKKLEGIPVQERSPWTVGLIGLVKEVIKLEESFAVIKTESDKTAALKACDGLFVKGKDAGYNWTFQVWSEAAKERINRIKIAPDAKPEIAPQDPAKKEEDDAADAFAGLGEKKRVSKPFQPKVKGEEEAPVAEGESYAQTSLAFLRQFTDLSAEAGKANDTKDIKKVHEKVAKIVKAATSEEKQTLGNIDKALAQTDAAVNAVDAYSKSKNATLKDASATVLEDAKELLKEICANSITWNEEKLAKLDSDLKQIKVAEEAEKLGTDAAKLKHYQDNLPKDTGWVPAIKERVTALSQTEAARVKAEDEAKAKAAEEAKLKVAAEARAKVLAEYKEKNKTDEALADARGLLRELEQRKGNAKAEGAIAELGLGNKIADLEAASSNPDAFNANTASINLKELKTAAASGKRTLGEIKIEEEEAEATVFLEKITAAKFELAAGRSLEQLEKAYNLAKECPPAQIEAHPATKRAMANLEKAIAFVEKHQNSDNETLKAVAAELLDYSVQYFERVCDSRGDLLDTSVYLEKIESFVFQAGIAEKAEPAKGKKKTPEAILTDYNAGLKSNGRIIYIDAVFRRTESLQATSKKKIDNSAEITRLNNEKPELIRRLKAADDKNLTGGAALAKSAAALGKFGTIDEKNLKAYQKAESTAKEDLEKWLKALSSAQKALYNFKQTGPNVGAKLRDLQGLSRVVTVMLKTLSNGEYNLMLSGTFQLEISFEKDGKLKVVKFAYNGTFKEETGEKLTAYDSDGKPVPDELIKAIIITYLENKVRLNKDKVIPGKKYKVPCKITS